MKQWMSNISRFPYQKIYLFGLYLFAIGLPLSKSLMTISLGILTIHWLVSEGYRRLPVLRTPTGIAFYAFLTIYLLHLSGLFHSIDIAYAAKDLRIKLPLLLLPLLMVSAFPLSSKQMTRLLKIFVLAVLAGSLVSLYILIHTNPVDPRHLTPFISHIRFSMMVCVAVSILIYWLWQQKRASFFKAAPVILMMLWFVTFLILLEALTGIIALSIVLMTTFVFLFFQIKKTWVKTLCGTLAGAIVVTGIVIGLQIRKEFIPDLTGLSIDPHEKTAAGNDYVHDLQSPVNENGHLVWLYVCKDELREEWNKRSAISFDSVDQNGSRKGDVLLRYLTSKGLRKDAEGIAALSDNDIRKIERGITNYRYSRWNGLKRRFDELKWEYWQYKQGGEAAGHSILQRLELWRVGWSLALENPWTGVGTGDVKREFASQLHEKESSLSGSPMRAHNQYLTIFIAFGIPGLLLFIQALMVPLLLRKTMYGYLLTVFLLIMLLSMLTEDTLETQAGVSFFSFFYALWIFQNTQDSSALFVNHEPSNE